MTSTTWRTLWAQTAEAVGQRNEARWLCEQASGLDGDEFLADLDAVPTVSMVAALDAMVARYDQGEPLQYVLGRWGFRNLDLMVDRRVLIPRPETELVVEEALAFLLGEAADRRPWLVVDLGTGSGAIGLSVAAETPLGSAEVWLTDASPDALAVARANLAGLGRFGGGVRLAEGNWFDALPADLRGRIDLVVSNPPYVAVGDPDLAPAVADWEPLDALHSGEEGLDDLRHIIAEAPEWLAVGGALVVEIGYRQGEPVASLMREAGLADVEVRSDHAGHDRVARARRR